MHHAASGTPGALPGRCPGNSPPLPPGPPDAAGTGRRPRGKRPGTPGTEAASRRWNAAGVPVREAGRRAIRSVVRERAPHSLQDPSCQQPGEGGIEAVLGMTEPAGQHEALGVAGPAIEPPDLVLLEEMIVTAVNQDQRRRGDAPHQGLGILRIAPALREAHAEEPGEPAATPRV